jgi:hypothetical protein
MSNRVISSINYKDTSDDKVDIALRKLNLLRRYWPPTTDFESKHCQRFGGDNEPLSVATRTGNKDPWLQAAALAKPVPRIGRAI